MDPNKCRVNDSNDATVIISNTSRDRNVASARNIASALRQGVVPKTLTFADTHAIADTGATSIFVMAGTPMKNVRSSTMDPLTINLPNGKIIHSTHVCNISIDILSQDCLWHHSWASEFYARQDAK